MFLKIIHGDVLKKIKEIENESIDLCITSPPYWNLRDYGVEGQLGAEATMEEYLENSMQWIREVYRVLKKSGSFVLNIGDCWFRGEENKKSMIGKGIYRRYQFLSVSSFLYCRIISETDFICRGEHIHCKPNVPSPIRSRLKHSHEKLFWFVKDAKNYFFDKKPWMKEILEISKKRMSYGTIISCFSKIRSLYKRTSKKDSAFADNIKLGKTPCYRAGHALDYLKRITHTIEHSWRVIKTGETQRGFELHGRIPSQHIAPFPSALIEPYILSLCPIGGVVLDPFLGSGTTMRVAMEKNRNCIGIELNSKYIEYTKQRLNWNSSWNIEYIEKF